MESVPVLDERMNLPSSSAVSRNALEPVANHDQPLVPLLEIWNTVATVTAPSPPVNVPLVVVSVDPTLAVPFTFGEVTFLAFQAWDLAFHLAYRRHRSTALLQRNILPALLEQWIEA